MSRLANVIGAVECWVVDLGAPDARKIDPVPVDVEKSETIYAAGDQVVIGFHSRTFWYVMPNDADARRARDQVLNVKAPGAGVRR